MQFTWIEYTKRKEIKDDEGTSFDPPQYEEVPTGNGHVTSFGREPREGELEGLTTPEEFDKGEDTSLYKVVQWAFRAKNDEEKAKEKRKQALWYILDKITESNSQANIEIFTYNGHEYYADIESILATAMEISTMSPTAPIPTPNGAWRTADKEEDGYTPIYVKYNCKDFSGLRSALYKRSSENFGVKELHKSNVKQMYFDGATAEEIRSYDFNQDWK